MLSFIQFITESPIKWVPGQKDWKTVTGQQHTYSVEHRPISWLKTTDRTIPSREKKVLDKVRSGGEMDMIVAGADGTIHDGHHRRKMALKYHDKDHVIPIQVHRLKEDWDDKPAMKGWMSPSGVAHMFSHHGEHRHNHHPEYIKQGGKHGDSLEHAQAKGFVRFGANANSFHGQHHFVHYDDTHPKGRETALKALQYMRPKHNDEVAVSGRGGLFKKGKANRTVMGQLGREAVVPASKAAEMIRAGKNTKPAPRPKPAPVQRKEMSPEERQAWIASIKDHLPKGMRTEAFLEEEHLPVKIKQHPKNPSAYLAYHGRKRVGAAITWNDLNHGKFSIYKSETHPDYRQKGVMSQIYHHIEKTTGKQLHPASALSDDGHKFWSKYRPEAVKDDLRNHAHKLKDKDVSHPTHGPGKIERVGAGGVLARMPNGNNYHLSKDHDEVKKHLYGISESIDPAKLKKAMNHNDAYHILDSHEGTRGGTPAAGGCGVLAHALHKHLKGSKLVDIHNKTTGGTEHVGVHHGDHVYDAYGAHPVKHFVSRFQKREGVRGELEMTPHDPKRTANSEISTHPGTVAKMHAHLQKYL